MERVYVCVRARVTLVKVTSLIFCPLPFSLSKVFLEASYRIALL